MDATKAATPCGLIAKSLFNDTFQIVYSKTKEGLATSKEFIQVSHDDIAWASDVKYKFFNSDTDEKVWKANQWLDMTSQHFIVWMRTAGLPNFRKLWGSMSNVKAGHYQIRVNN